MLLINVARHKLPGLVSNLTSSAINKFGKEAVRAGKGFTWFISNEDISDVIKIIKASEDSVVWIDGVTQTVNLEIKIQEGRFLGALLHL